MSWWTEVVKNNKKSLQTNGYSHDICIDLIKEIERLNDGEEARIICDEKGFVNFFGGNNRFHGYKSKRLGMHTVSVNDKMINRYKEYFDIKNDYPLVLVCSSEFGTVGIIKC
jgi:hypothetical protein